MDMDNLQEEAHCIPISHPKHAEIARIVMQAAADYHFAAEEAKIYILGKARRRFLQLKEQT